MRIAEIDPVTRKRLEAWGIELDEPAILAIRGVLLNPADCFLAVGVGHVGHAVSYLRYRPGSPLSASSKCGTARGPVRHDEKARACRRCFPADP